MRKSWKKTLTASTFSRIEALAFSANRSRWFLLSILSLVATGGAGGIGCASSSHRCHRSYEYHTEPVPEDAKQETRDESQWRMVSPGEPVVKP